jgi:hypothetical protein
MHSSTISEHTNTHNTHTALNSNSSLTVNLSNLELSITDITLLDKGLSFIPTYKYLAINKIYEAQSRLIRNLKLKDYFAGKPEKDYDPKTKNFIAASTWTPPDHKVSESALATIQKIVSSTENVIKNNKIWKNHSITLKNFKNNLTNAEKLSLTKLRDNNSIIIKPADKGGATVIINKNSYINEAYRQLNNENYYVKLDQPIYKNNIAEINKILKSMENDGFISNKQFAYLQAREDDRARVFYLLPKIHKPYEKWPQKDMPEGRPIVSDCGSESYRVCQFVDSIIRPISIKHSSYIKDTYDFVNKIRGQKIPRNAILVTGDVSSLYTNMKIDRILTVTKNALAQHCCNTRRDKYILDLLKITLENNDFTFNDECFLQICGTAMGKTYAPGLADLYLQEFDYRACNDFRINPLLYCRFLDDIFFVWCGTTVELEEYENFLNSLIDGIKITLVASTEKVDFLDTSIYKKIADGVDVLQTRVFFKDTDTHQLLHKLSYHPKHTTKGVLKAQLLRFKRISSSFSDYTNTCTILFKALSKRGYSKSLLRKMKRDIWALNETEKTRSDQDLKQIIPVVIPYNEIGTKLAHLWKTSIGENEIFKDRKLITAYCNSKNLHKQLVRSTLLPAAIPLRHRTVVSSNLTAGCRRCASIKCKACNFIIESNSFKSTNNNRIFKLTDRFNCKTNNIVYLITCKKCNKQYVGETGRSLGERINDHMSCIRLKKQTPIGLHFNQTGHSLKDFAISGIEKFIDNQNSSNLRRLKESTWQNLLQTAHPLGLNNLKKEHLS